VLLKKNNRVYVDFPKVGLGNMLLVWARAVVFCKINNLDYTTASWWGLRWGALLRKETKKRLYFQYFIESSFFSRVVCNLKKIFFSFTKNPELKISSVQKKDFFIFDKVNINDDLFFGLRDYKTLIKKRIEESLHPRIQNILLNEPVSDISIHVRRGDFKAGNPITPLSHFITGISLIRKIAKKNIDVTVFSDASIQELTPLLNLENIKMANNNPDIVDIVLMSKSKIIFLSQSSSFSYWAAFLSDSLVIIPTNDWQHKICNENELEKYKEFRWDESKTIPSDLILNATNNINNL
jgi:hypothetical protein